MDAGGAGRLNRSSPSCLNRPAQRTAFFHGLSGGTDSSRRCLEAADLAPPGRAFGLDGNLVCPHRNARARASWSEEADARGPPPVPVRWLRLGVYGFRRPLGRPRRDAVSARAAVSTGTHGELQSLGVPTTARGE